ncbi:hypothetical protein AG1IA_03011 [Rhizoctonia solani AG-1 IA]|uniref:Uncharacterized protein n=1 Tax=Thanatephorus cucumeris (strain AG1-IA) TaxID=983506 RepID=L8X1R4_THACA|nr:hypothetical protein AG1IA_03011 [Rhizoctonia solani AG-1 IA]
MLLQGDIFFYDTEKNHSPPIPMTYGEILGNNGLIASSLSLKPNSVLRMPDANLSRYRFYLEAHLVACDLMASIHITTASYLSLVGMGAEFQCKTCLDAKQVTWVELVRHYIISNEFFKKNLKIVRSLGGCITHRNAHDTYLPTQQTMVGSCSIDPQMELDAHTGKRRKGLLCAQVPGLKDVVAPEWAIVRHLQDVPAHTLTRHGIAEPAACLHYTPQHVYDSIADFGGYGLPPHDLSFGGCGPEPAETHEPSLARRMRRLSDAAT